MKNLISSVFSHELKNNLSSIRFGLEMFDKYDMSQEEKKSFIKDTLVTINNSIHILDEYMNFVKFQFRPKLKYENIDIYELLVEIKKELKPLLNEKYINIYIQNNNITFLTNKHWLKKALYNIILNSIKYNKTGGSISIRIEDSIFGIYLSINDTGIGTKTKDLSTTFKSFYPIDDTKTELGIGLALSKSVIESFGGKIHVRSNETIGTDFILYIPKQPKAVKLKKLAIAAIPTFILLFFTISYFPIYSQNYTKRESVKYIIYTLEDGSVLTYDKQSKYTFNAYKNLYNTKFSIYTKLLKGDMSLHAIKNKATIKVDDKSFYNLGTDFEIIKDNKTKVAVFEGKVKNEDVLLNAGEGSIFGERIKVVSLLPAPKYLKFNNDVLEFQKNKEEEKYKIIVALNKDFSEIKTTVFSVNNKIKLSFDDDTLYYIKVFGYDKYGLPSMPAVTTYISLNHYKKALQLEKFDLPQAMIELKNSISTIQNYSSLPYYELAKIYYKQQKYTKAINYIQQALKIDDKKEYYYVLFGSYFKLNQLNKLKKVDDLLKKYPKDSKFIFYKAVCLYADNKNKEASALLFNILQKNPNFKEGNALLSKVLMKLNKIQEAKYYERLSK